jgi:ketosteroid isomerase-like protein
MPPKLIYHFLFTILILTFTFTANADELSSLNKQTVEQYMNAFNKADHAEILSCLTNDVEWILPGVYDLKGKEAFDKEIANDAFIQPPVIIVTRVVEENDVVVAEGTVQTKKKTGEVINLVFCDVFVMQDGKIKQLTSYLMEVKQN